MTPSVTRIDLAPSGQPSVVAPENALPAPMPLGRDASRDKRFAAMATEHVDVLWRTLARLGVPDGSVEDAVQQVLLVALRRLPEIEVGRERPYLLGIALRVASDARRSLRRRREILLSDALVLQETRAPQDELLHHKRNLSDLEAALADLSDENRDAFVLFEIEELSAPQVAELLGVPVGTVASRVRRAREQIRRKLLKEGPLP
jgi:RNA polymerase sigma-70 factor, ECF subfamily